MKTGLESLNTGASKITYSGNEGPKAPMKMAGSLGDEKDDISKEIFGKPVKDLNAGELEELMEELERLREKFRASKQDEGIGNLAMADPLLEDEYQKYVFEMEEQGLQPMSFEEFKQQAMSGMAEGGVAQLVKNNTDGSRPGYRGIGGYQEGKSEPSSSGGTTGGNGGNGGDNNKVDPGFQNALKQQKIEQKKKEAQDLGFRTTGSQVYSPPSFFQNLKNKSFQSGINRNKVAALRKMSLLNKGLPSFFGKFISGVTGKVPDWAKDMTEEELNEVAADIQGIKDYNQATYNYNLNPDKKGSGSELLSRTFDAQDILDTGQMTQSKYEELFPGPNVSTDDRDGSQIILPPVMPTTGMAVGEDVDIADTEDFVNRFAPVKNLPFANYRGGIEVAADGGRIGYAGGGITDLRQGYFLGKLVKKATRAVKKIAKSPIGKAALIAGLGYFAGGGGNPFTAAGRGKFDFANLLSLKNNRLLSSVKDGERVFSPFRSIALASALPLLMPQEQEEENLDAMAASRAGDINPFDQFNGITGLRRKVLAGNLDRAQFPFMNQSFYAADGGRIGFANGGNDDEDETIRAQALGALYSMERPKFSDGGAGLPPITAGIEGQNLQSFSDDETPMPTQPDQMPKPRPMMNPMMARGMNPMMASRMNPMMSMQPRMMAQEGGLMDMGGMEKDYRNEGGFVPIGGQERADDVPARLSKNEFVFTADAVRNAGGGDIDKGAEIMENMMENLEQGGKVSEESQGLSGARAMFATQQRLGEVL